MKKLILIDGSFYIFRAYYAMRQGFTNSKGKPTGAIFGFKQMLMSTIERCQPDYIAIAFDLPTPTFRHNLYDLYKANRDAPPEDLIAQIQPIYRLVESLSIQTITKSGYEADDIIGTLSAQFKDQVEVTIVSADKDLMQLVTKEVHIWDPMKNKVYNPEAVKEKYAVLPSQIADYLALVGDTADNIPGAAGIGPKKAEVLLADYENIDEIYANLSQITPANVAKKLEDSKEVVAISQKLTPICLDVPLDYTLESLEVKPVNAEKLSAFYQEMNFKADKLLEVQQEIAEVEDNWNYENYKLIQTETELEAVIATLQSTNQIAVDLETTSLFPIEALLVGISFAVAKHSAFYIPVGHITDEKQLDCDWVLQQLTPIFKDTTKEWIGQNLKYDMLVFRKYNIELEGKIQDTMIQAYLLEAGGKHSLDYLSQKYLEHTTIAYSEVTKEYKGKFAEVPLATALRYAAEDSDVAWQLYQILQEEIKKERMIDLYENLEIPLCRVLTTMEYWGVAIDVPVLNQLKEELQQECDVLTKKIYQEAGEEFNINSPQQLSVILFEKLNIQESRKKTKTGYSTDAKVLSRLEGRYPIASYLLNYRTYMKLINTYLDVLPQMLNAQTKRVHTTYSQTVTATGRLSSTRPNLQNIPIRGKEGEQIRSGFVAKEGYILLSVDYSQIELRMLAHLSQEENLLLVYKNKGDIHKETAAAMYKCPLDEVSSNQRRNAKAINFGIMYGMGAFRLGQDLGIPQSEAKKFIALYFKKYPKIQEYIDQVIATAEKKGYVETLLQRRRYIPDINAKNQLVRASARRMAFNTCVQGSAADLIKKAMLSIQNEISNYSDEIRMILQIHDELVFEVQEIKLEKWKDNIVNKMETSLPLSVPLQADSGFGKNWLIAH